MLNKKVEEILNEQVTHEGESYFQYLAMASWMENNKFHGSAKFLYQQAEEEKEHMMKLFHYINDAGGFAKVPHLKQPTHEYDSFLQAFELILAQETKISESIDRIVELTLSEKSYATFNFIQWYVAEQLEEENLFRTLLDKIKLAGTDHRGLYLIDEELGRKAGMTGE